MKTLKSKTMVSEVSRKSPSKTDPPDPRHQRLADAKGIFYSQKVKRNAGNN